MPARSGCLTFKWQQYILLFRELPNVRDDFIGNLFTIKIPMLSIFLGASLVMAKGSVEEKACKENKIKIRHKIIEKGGDAPEKSA